MMFGWIILPDAGQSIWVNARRERWYAAQKSAAVIWRIKTVFIV